METRSIDAGSASPLEQTVRRSSTEIWNDGPAVAEIDEAMAHGAVGATSNPSLILEVMANDRAAWKALAGELRAEHPTWSIAEIAWSLYSEVARRAADTLRPVYEREHGREGYVSVQVDPTQYANPAAMVEQALTFAGIADNVRVKLPVTSAGVQAIEEATAHGISVTSTVCFSVPQAIATAEAVERGLRARAAMGNDIGSIHPVCTIMVGRLDDWLRAQTERDGIIVDPGILDWAGVAVMKRAYGIYRARGYRTRLLAAAFRSHLHWSQLIGGELSLTIPLAWQRRFNRSGVEVRSRIDDQVDLAIVDGLSAAFADFRRAYSADGMTPDEFDSFPPTVRTLRAFTRAYFDLLALVADFLLPDPGVAGS